MKDNISIRPKGQGRYPKPFDYRPRPGGFYWERMLYQSPAYCSLTATGHMVLTALLDARIFNNVKINGKKERILVNGDSLTLPYKKLMDVYFMNMAGITRGIDDVLAKGLAKLVHQGGGGKHDQSVFALAEDYLRWTPGVVFYKRPKVIRRGFQDPANQRHRKNSRSQNDRLIRIAK